MTNRRIFMKYTGAIAIGSLFLNACNSGETKEADDTTSEAGTDSSATAGNAASAGLGAIGVQLWSVKDVLEKDLKGTLQQLGAMGYKEIESYPGEKGHYYGLEPKDFKNMLSDAGLTLVSSHFGSGSSKDKPSDWHRASMLNNLDQLVDKAAETGQQYLTCSSLDESLRKTPDDLKRTAELFNKTGEACKKGGLQFAYHNHATEFEKIGDTVMYDFMLANTDPSLVQYELDMYWVVEGGQDPVTYFNKYPNRFALGHVKDMDKQNRQKNTEVGTGSIDYVTILKAAKAAGMKHFIVEQESFTRPSIESMKMNYDYLSKLSV